MLKEKMKDYIGQPIGIELANGVSVSGILCDVTDDKLYVMEYLYQAKFVQKEYDLELIVGVYLFPSCRKKELLN